MKTRYTIDIETFGRPRPSNRDVQTCLAAHLPALGDLAVTAKRKGPVGGPIPFERLADRAVVTDKVDRNGVVSFKYAAKVGPNRENIRLGNVYREDGDVEWREGSWVLTPKEQRWLEDGLREARVERAARVKLEARREALAERQRELREAAGKIERWSLTGEERWCLTERRAIRLQADLTALNQHERIRYERRKRGIGYTVEGWLRLEDNRKADGQFR